MRALTDWEWSPLKNRSFVAQLASGLLLAGIALVLTGCGQDIYKEPAYTFAGRPVPPSQIQQRVLASYTSNGTSGGLEILDGLRDIRSNVQNTIPVYTISGYSGGNPTTILNYPEQTVGYVFSSSDGGLTAINYSKEASAGAVGSYSPTTPSVAASADGTRFAAAQSQTGQIILTSNGANYNLNLPNVDKVVINSGNTVILAMVRNSNSLYRIVKVNQTNTPVFPPGYVDCQPLILPVFCVVPVPGTYDRPSDVSFSLDGTTAYVLNCGPECGGVQAGVSLLQEGALTVDVIPTALPYPSVMSVLPVANPIPVPGGVTEALSNGSTLYLAGQSQQTLLANGTLANDPVNPLLFTGYLSTLNLSTYKVSTPVSISDGRHSKLIFADDNTMWVGSQQCASGKRAATNQNYNCLTMVNLGTNVAQVVPLNIIPNGAATVAYPNSNQNQYYYGSLTGICWVQSFHKMYTAYGGQTHVFVTGTVGTPGAEIDNEFVTIQGTVLDVAYMDAVTNGAN